MPIEGYANERLIPLEEAIEPFVSFVHDIEMKAARTKGKCEDVLINNSTRKQSAPINLYSMSWKPTVHSANGFEIN